MNLINLDLIKFAQNASKIHYTPAIAKAGQSVTKSNPDLDADKFFNRNSNGYRLPTDLEQEYVRMDRGRSMGDFFTGIDLNNIRAVAWFNDNASSLQPVELLDPLVIEKQPFYDLIGNAHELSHDWNSQEHGTNIHKIRLFMRGGTYLVGDAALSNKFRSDLAAVTAVPYVSFRLVRTLP